MNSSSKNQVDFPRRMLALGSAFDASAGNVWSMVGPESEALPPDPGTPAPDDDFHRNNPYAIGAKRSFVPVLGEVVWELPKSLAAANIPFVAYVFRTSDGRHIGYLRVPHYSFDENAAYTFGEVIARLETTTEAMVLDQVNNPGGNIFKMYALLSFLADRDLALPRHQQSIDDDQAAWAARILRQAGSGNARPSERPGFEEMVAYARVLVAEIHAGRKRITNPVHLGGVSEIHPAGDHYTKKIVVLINELDFSAAEFLAAILQDNKRATLFGERTAGAGGCVKRIRGSHNELLGVDYVTVTWTLALRTDGRPIENVGVHPDVGYSTTVEDLRGGYDGYRRALLATISA